MSASPEQVRNDRVMSGSSLGRSVHVCAATGETLFTVAARLGHLEMITLLSNIGFAVRSDASLSTSLIPSTLQTVRKYGLQTHEFETMWSSVANRLVSIYSLFEQEESLSQSTFLHYLTVLVCLIKLLPKCKTKSIFTRLVMCRSVVSSFEDIHAEIDYLLRGNDFRELDAFDCEWTAKDEEAVSQNLGSELDQIEALSLLKNELRVRSAQCSPELLELLKSAYSTALRCSSIPVTEPPRWFIPFYEIKFDETAAAGTEDSKLVLHGEWLNSVVTVHQLDLPSDAFIAEIDRRFSLSHPNVIKCFGASHVRSPLSVVFENVVSTNLREYLSVKANRHLLWSKLYEVALGVKYLHERGVVLGNLQCSSVCIGTDGLSKIAGLGEGVSAKQPAREQQSVRWRSPECMRGESTAASNI